MVGYFLIMNVIRKALKHLRRASDLKPDLISCVKIHERFSSKVYRCTSGKMTIGYGRNLESLGISQDEALIMLKNDIARCELELSHFEWFNKLDKVRREALIELNLNMGLPSLLTFKRMIKQLQLKNWDEAANELMRSEWALQVGDSRAISLFYRIKDGKY